MKINPCLRLLLLEWNSQRGMFRHPMIFDKFEALAPGEGFILLNDHNPKPLYHQFQAELAGQFTWDVLEEGPEEWRVRIGRAAAA